MPVSIRAFSPFKVGIVRHTPRPWLIDPNTGNTYFVPSTVPLHPEPNDRVGIANPILVTPQIWEYTQKINNPDGFRYTQSIGNMLDNRGDGRVVAIACGGNPITWDLEINGYVRVISIDVSSPTDNLDPEKDNWYYHPELFWKASSVDGYGKISKVGEGLDVYWPLIHGNSRLWLSYADLEVFPLPPFGMKYVLRGADVYGIQNGETIPLLENGQFLTDWFRLQTKGVIPPS